MKNHLVFPFLATLAFGSCERSVSDTGVNQDAQAEEDRAAVQAAADALEFERAQVQAEREEIEVEKQELRLQRAAALAEKEQELLGLEAELALQNEDARRAAEDLAAEQAELERREQELNELELQQAGTTAIADWTPAEPEVVQEPVADYSLFYDELEPHGDWFETQQYGYIYQPTVVVQNRSWRPYTHGKWVCSNLGWTWRSDEPFGWATFHYGRWALLSGRGWCWVPGSEWAPSWCAWRQGGGHVGWAPLPPETLAYRGRGWGSDADVDLGISNSWFNFVENRHMASTAYKHCLPVSRNRHFVNSTRGCTNLRYEGFRAIAGGPSYKLIKPLIHEPWPVCKIDLDAVGGFGRGKGVEGHRQGVRQGNRLKLFAPSVNAPWNPGLRPKKIADKWKSLKVVRAQNGLQQTWARRLADARAGQQENARLWAKKNEDRREARELQLQHNRGKVAAAQARNREKINSKPQPLVTRGAKPTVPSIKVPVKRGPGVGGVSTGGRVAKVPQLPPGVTRPGDIHVPPVVSNNGRGNGRDNSAGNKGRRPRVGNGQNNGRGKGGASPPAEDHMAELKRQQTEARERAAQRTAEARARVEAARNASKVPTTKSKGGNDAIARMNERLEQSRQQREKASQEKVAQKAVEDRAARLAQSNAAIQEKIRLQQEQNRATQNRAKMDQQRRQQQAKTRAAQEKTKQAQAERARQSQEQAKKRVMADRRAAGQAAREKQAAAQGAAEKYARQQQDLARRQEEARRASQERAKQQQEKAREAAEQRARQRGQNQQRIREAQEKIRERIREQQQQRKK